MDNTATQALELLQRLIATPSLSRDESRTGDLLEEYLTARGARPERFHNNVWARSEGFDPEYGARPLRRAIQQRVEDALSEEILSGKITIGDTVKMEVIDDKLTFTRVDIQN